MIVKNCTSGWKAHLRLELDNRNGRTVVTRRRHQGPLLIQKAFYPEKKPCHLYLLHPPGGLVSGDELHLDAQLNTDSHCLMTTPGATKFYRSSGPAARQMHTLRVANGALLEWLPQETIVFDKSHAYIHTHVELQAQAKYIGWEITCLGRTAGAEPFKNGLLVQKTMIDRCAKPEFIERTLLQGGSSVLHARWGLANYATTGLMIITPATVQLLEAVRAQIIPNDNELFSATLLDSLMVCRYLGPQAQSAKRLFTKVWKIARPLVQNIDICVPRIWYT